MTGPDHYCEAERLLAAAFQRHSEIDGRLATYEQAMGDRAAIASAIALAQAHATLALTAATAYPAIVAYVGKSDEDESRHWAEVTS
jgi:hypothetical protein